MQEESDGYEEDDEEEEDIGIIFNAKHEDIRVKQKEENKKDTKKSQLNDKLKQHEPGPCKKEFYGGFYVA